MKRTLILTGALVLAVVGGTTANAAKITTIKGMKISDRSSSLLPNVMENHGVKMKAGRHYVSVATRNSKPASVVLIHVTKDTNGKLQFREIKPRRKRLMNGAGAFEYDIPSTGAYLITVASRQRIEAYTVATTGTFVGKAIRLKMKKK